MDFMIYLISAISFYLLARYACMSILRHRWPKAFLAAACIAFAAVMLGLNVWLIA